MMDRLLKGRLIYLINETQGLFFKNLAFYVVDLISGKRILIGKIPSGFPKRLLNHFRLAERLLRLEPKCVGRLDEKRYVVCIIGRLWLLDAQNHTISELCTTRPGFSVLNFCEHDGSVYWGDYGYPNHEKINIYRLDKDLNISTVYSFPEDSVRHIHNIKSANDGFIVLTGDNEPVAGIYRANTDWSEVIAMKNGEQKYRTVVGFPYQGGLLYATDSVETENYLRLIDADGNERNLATINGSCIYGGESKEFFLFSTTVESHEGGGWRKLLSNKLGGGIKTRDVHIIAVSKSDLSIRILKKVRKDIWPMKLFQYGTAVFPKGQDNIVEGVWYYNMATKKGDGKTMFLSFNEQDS